MKKSAITMLAVAALGVAAPVLAAEPTDINSLLGSGSVDTEAPAPKETPAAGVPGGQTGLGDTKNNPVANPTTDERTDRVNSHIQDNATGEGFVDTDKEAQGGAALAELFNNVEKSNPKYVNLFTTQEGAQAFATRRGAMGRTNIEIKQVSHQGVVYYYVTDDDSRFSKEDVLKQVELLVASQKAPNAEDKKDAKKASNKVAAAKTATGSKTLPKTSAAK